MLGIPDKYIDKWNLIVQESGDGGDSAQRWAMYHFLIPLLDSGVKLDYFNINKLEYPLGTLRRHPDINKWYSNPYNCSRDQQRAYIMMLGQIKDGSALLSFFMMHILRLGFYQNIYPNFVTHPTRKDIKIPDYASPQHWGEYIRAFNSAGFKAAKILYPYLLLGDLFMLLSSVLTVHNSKDRNEADDNNHILSLLQATISMPTPFSSLARWYYLKYRKIAGLAVSSSKYGSGAISALQYYFRPSTGAPPMDKIAIDVITKYWNL